MTPRVLHMGAPAFLATLPAESVDAVVTDPPYAEVDRDYGRLTEAEWRSLMDAVVPEVRRVLKPRGSAVFILQPTSERVGRMRAWLFRWVADMCEQWNLVQDAYWWNVSALPVGGAPTQGLLRPAVKPCVWLGPADCYRDQASVLWTPTERAVAMASAERVVRVSPSGRSVNNARMGERAIERDGVTPFNVLPIPNADSNSDRSAGAKGHGAGTPYALAAWWVRYLCPEGGLVVDPFAGSGTMGYAALDQGRRWLGADSDPQWAQPDGLTEPPQVGLFAGLGGGR